ncbi:MAG: hypothetical protein M1820_007957 [Bogoriella megaspora]|nr:MAG: hypothetical protein M1820_007957 [Bogoriella megaspora]
MAEKDCSEKRAVFIPNSSLEESDEATNIVLQSKAHDEALDFLKQHRDDFRVELGFDPDYIKRLKRKLDLYILPFMLVVYMFNFLDKILLNYGNVMGLSKDLKLKGNDYSNASSAFWFANLAAAIINIYLVQRLPTSKWLGTCLLGWSISTACTAATQNYGGLLATRIISGAFEAVVPPAAMLLTAQYYTKSEQAARFSTWYIGVAIGQILGGLISWAFQHVGIHASLAGWRIMFLALGLVTLIFALSILLFLPDTPMQAWFLSNEEKVALLEHIKTNQTGVEGRRFIPKQIGEAMCDFQIWAVFIIMVLNGSGGGVITAYSATLVKSFGYTAKQSALLLMGNGPVVLSTTLIGGIGSRYFGQRWAWIILVTIPAIIGSCLMAWPVGNKQHSALAGVFLVNAYISLTPILYQWTVSNVAGHTKRSFASAMIQAAFAVGNIIGPQTFQAKDAPDYQPAKVSMVVFLSVMICLVATLALYYRNCNRTRNQRSTTSDAAEDISDAKAYSGLTDKENVDFRYTY